MCFRMHMFGLEGSGFIIALGVTLLVSGAIVYYCNSRISTLEKALIQQNQVLSDFIVNMRTSLDNHTQNTQNTQNQLVNNQASNIAIDAAKMYYSDTIPENKIEVSEDMHSEHSENSNETDKDSSSELDSESESDEESDAESDAESDSEDKKPIILEETDNAQLDIEEVEVENSSSDTDNQNHSRVIELTNGGFDLSTDYLTDVQEVIKLGDVDNIEELEKATAGSLSDGSSLSSHDDEDDASTVLSAKLAVTDLKKIKVTQLKEMAVSSGKTPSEAKKMKKAELIEFLEAKRAELD